MMQTRNHTWEVDSPGGSCNTGDFLNMTNIQFRSGFSRTTPDILGRVGYVDMYCLFLFQHGKGEWGGFIPSGPALAVALGAALLRSPPATLGNHPHQQICRRRLDSSRGALACFRTHDRTCGPTFSTHPTKGSLRAMECASDMALNAPCPKYSSPGV